MRDEVEDTLEELRGCVDEALAKMLELKKVTLRPQRLPDSNVIRMRSAVLSAEALEEVESLNNDLALSIGRMWGVFARCKKLSAGVCAKSTG